MHNVAIGIDLGGTFVRAGAFDEQGNMLAVRETLIEAARGPESGLRKIHLLIEQVQTESASPSKGKAQSLVGIGIGSAGPVDSVRGIIHNPFTLPSWDHVPIVDEMQKAFHVPVTLENDADVAALGEYWQGAGQSVKKLYAVTAGTGIGTALIEDGRIYRGMDGFHPEGGHMLLDSDGPLCYCGMHGCWESFCAGPSIVRDVLKMDLSNSRLLEMADGNRKRIDAHMITDAAREGDPVARRAIEKAARYFSRGIANIIINFVPDMIVLSGGLMKSADLFLTFMPETIEALSVMIPAEQVKILSAQLGYHAGLYGAAYTIWSQTNGQIKK